MIELVVVACLLSNPAHCRDFSLGINEGNTRNCIMQSQPTIAEWAGNHPKWNVVRIECSPINKGNDI